MGAIQQIFRGRGMRWVPWPLPATGGQRPVGELERLRRELVELRAQSQSQSRLFAAAVHDLRQPLQAIMLFTEVLMLEEPSASQQDARARIRNCVDAMERLSTELLDLARIEPGALEPQRCRLDLAPLLDNVQRTFHPVARRRGLRLVVRPTSLCAQSDAPLLARVLNHLVSNALFNTRQGGVLVGARREGEGVRIDICNSGAVAEAAGQGAEMGLGQATLCHLASLLGARIALRTGQDSGMTVSLHFAA